MTARPASRGPGRRPGTPDTRGAILDAARRLFADRGYDATTLRGVAREAGVDPALVHHYFDGKHQLFVAATGIPVDPDLMVSAALDGDFAGMGERMLRTFLGLWESGDNRTRLMGFVRSVTTNEAAAAMMREAFGHILFDRVAPRLSGPDVGLRLTAAMSQLVGLAMARYVVAIEPLASADLDELVPVFAPTLQRYLTGR
ncbi:MAG TPA: TetR family transcriptional regulator [Streptosporangiales bacterium]